MEANRAWFSLTLLAFLGGVSAQTADEVIARNLEAKGGSERLGAVRTIKQSGTISVGGGMAEGAFELFQSRPNRIRLNVGMMGAEVVQAFDGEKAWMLMPLAAGGSGFPEEMPPEVAQQFSAGADIDGPFVNYVQKGNQVIFIGTEQVDGKSMHHLEVTLKEGLVQHFYFDAATHLEAKMVSRQPNPQTGGEATAEQIFSDFKEVDGILFAHSLETRFEGRTFVHILIEQVSVNGPLDESLFLMPRQ